MVCNKVLLHLRICFSVILLFSSCQMCEDPCLASVFHILYSDSGVTFHIITLTELQQKWFSGVL